MFAAAAAAPFAGTGLPVRPMGDVSDACLSWARSRFDFDGYRAMLRAEVDPLLARKPLAPYASGGESTRTVRVDAWPAFVDAAARWVDDAGALLERLGAKVNLPRYWLTWQVPDLQIREGGASYTFYPRNLTAWWGGAWSGGRVLEFWHNRLSLGAVFTMGGVRAMSVAATLLAPWTAPAMAQQLVVDPMLTSGLRTVAPSSTAQIRMPGPIAHVGIVEAILRYVAARPVDRLVADAGAEFGRLVDAALSRLHPSTSGATKARIAGAVGTAAAGANAVPVYGQAISAALAALAAAIAIMPLARAERTFCGLRDPVDGQPHYSLCWLGDDSINRWKPDPYLSFPPADCARTDTPVYVPPPPGVPPPGGTPPAEEKKTSTALKIAAGISVIGVAAAIGLAVARSR